MKNPEQVMAGRIVAAVDADEKSEGCDLSAGMFGLEMSNYIREMVALEERAAKAEVLLAECQRLTWKDGSSLWEVIHEFLGSPEDQAYYPPEQDKLPHPDRGHMWQFIDNALQGTVEASLRGNICNKLAPLLIPAASTKVEVPDAGVPDIALSNIAYWLRSMHTAPWAFDNGLTERMGQYADTLTRLRVFYSGAVVARDPSAVPFAYTYIHDFEHGNGWQRDARGFEEARFWDADDVPKTYRNIQALYL